MYFIGPNGISSKSNLNEYYQSLSILLKLSQEFNVSLTEKSFSIFVSDLIEVYYNLHIEIIRGYK